MLSKEALTSALPLATVFDDRRILVMPVAGTPLAKLVEATRSDSKLMATIGGEFNPLIDEIAYMANVKDPVLEHSLHDRVMDEITTVCIEAVRNHMSQARTVVAPAVQEMVEKTAEAMGALAPSSLLGMEVVSWLPPAPMTSPAFETMVRKFQEVPYDVPRMGVNCPDVGMKELTDMLLSGSGSVDASVGEWIAAKGESFFVGLWSDMFQMKPVGEHDSPRDFRSYMEDPEYGLDNALAVFLWARKLVEGALPETNMPARSFETYMAEFRDQAGARLCRGFDEMATAFKNKQLIKAVYGNVTVVFDNVYKEWLEEGGSNEVLFGNLLSQPFSTHTDVINARAAELKQKWNTHAALTKLTEANRNFMRTKDILRTVFEAQIQTLSDPDEANANNLTQVMKLFEEQLDNVRVDELENLWGVCLRLVCRSRFYRTDAERILTGVERAKKANPEIDVREAAAASMIEYIGHWVASQLRFESI